MIAALFVETGGAYFGIEGVEPYDIRRDAMKYAGPWPVVAHPPCARWSRLAALVESKGGPRRGDDGGTFAYALDCVRRFGGVLEHPAWSSAWPAYGLPTPPAEGWRRTFCGGWVCQVEQAHYGHEARKGTWLYAVGCELPLMMSGPARDEDVACVVTKTRGANRHRRPEMRKSQRSRTPIAFRDVLIGMARTVNRYRLVADSGASSGPPLLPADRVDGAAAGRAFNTQETPQ